MLAFPDGHFYSPIPSLLKVREREAEIFRSPDRLPEIELRSEQQVGLLPALAESCLDQPFTDEVHPGLRYNFINNSFGHGDALVYHALLRHLRPKRLVEVGSGFTSALALDTNDLFLNGTLQCTFIDPYSSRLKFLLRNEEDSCHCVIERAVETVDIGVFAALERGDFLFIDSTHVSKVGSDVNFLLFEVLPHVRPGVIIHFHDIFFPFEYPREWILAGRAWNEAYILRAFLMGSPQYQILWWNSYLEQKHRAQVAGLMPLWDRNPGGSLWLEKV